MRENVASGFLKHVHANSHNQLADLMTKPLPLSFHFELSKLGILDIFTPQLEGVLDLHLHLSVGKLVS